MRPIITVKGLSKQYRLGKAQRPMYGTLRDTVVEFAQSRFRKRRQAGDSSQTIWALRNVSFEVGAGEVIGIIGSNGAGKSTLLKIISRITEPTTGRAELFGRVGSLLEVGTGFHPELSGRENIFLNGALLGMRRAEISAKFDEIVAFSEVERFIDTPVKFYSSGMYMRLAFSVAAHLEPEILVVDEVLAVGDMAFQKKCLGKLGSVAEGGRTILFVSHNMLAMQNLCSRVVWLDHGKVAQEGDSGDVIANYLKGSFSTRSTQTWADPANAPGNEIVRLRSASVFPEQGSPFDEITVQSPVVLEFEFWNFQPGATLNLSMHLINDQGVTVFASGSGKDKLWRGPYPVGLFRSRCRIPGGLLNDGAHSILLLVVKNNNTVISSHPDLLSFEVREAVESREFWFGKWPGAVRPDLEWTTEAVDSHDTTMTIQQ
jgi:lipopolysaccharide transport system ATP-binding protein